MHKAKIKCRSRQEKNFVINNLKIAINKYYTEEIYDDYYIQHSWWNLKSFDSTEYD